MSEKCGAKLRQCRDCGTKFRKGDETCASCGVDRSLSLCKRSAGWGTDHVGTGRCRTHGGGTPSGAKSPHFKNGEWAYAFRSRIFTKYEAALGNEKPLDLLPELALQRAMLAEYIDVVEEKSEEKGHASLEQLDNMVVIAERIAKTATQIANTRAKEAFTNAEIDFIREGLKSGLVKYVDPNKQRAFVDHIRKFLPGWSGDGADDGE